MSENRKESIPGYDFGSPKSTKSPVSPEELRHLEQTLEWTVEDERMLGKYAEFFRSQAESMVDAWRAVIGAQPHLAQWFRGPDGNPEDEYKAHVKRRFVQWVVDVAARPHDQVWLDYQEEIGLRHTPEKKNKTDNRHTPPNVPLRYLVAFVPVVTDIRRFIGEVIHDAAELDSVERAWMKAVHLHVALWCRPYAKEGLW